MGSVTGTGRVGGLVGLNYWDGEIINSYSHSSVSGESSDIGGLIGEVYGVTLINSYSTGQVTGSGSYVGGLIGYKTSWNNRICGGKKHQRYGQDTHPE